MTAEVDPLSAIRQRKVLEEDGKLTLTDLPFKRGESVCLVVSKEPPSEKPVPTFTASELLESGLVGLWVDRGDIGESSEYARKLREEAWTRKW